MWKVIKILGILSWSSKKEEADLLLEPDSSMISLKMVEKSFAEIAGGLAFTIFLSEGI